MFEVLITLLVTVIVLIFDLAVFWELVLIVSLVLVLWPAFYAMIKGAPYVPTRKRDIERMLKIGRFKKGERVVELGFGDGRVMRAIEKLGCDVMGYEFSPATYWAGRVVHFFKSGKGEMRYGDFWKQDYKEADVLVCFLLINAMKDVKEKIWPNLEPGTRLISNQFALPGVKEVAREGNVFMYVKK